MDQRSISTMQACPETSDRLFGPRVDQRCRSFDFTLQFEDIILTCVPAAVLILLLPVAFLHLLKSRSTNAPHARLLVCKLVLLGSLFITQFVFSIIRARDDQFKTSGSVPADTLSVVATLGLLPLSYLDHHRSMRPFTILSLYLSIIAILSIARTRTLWLMASSSPVPAIMTLMSSLSFASVLLDSFVKGSRFRDSSKSDGMSEKCAPEQYSGFWQRTSFAWLLATLRLGYAKVLSVDDLPFLDTQLQSEVLLPKLMAVWSSYGPQRRHGLLKSCFRAFIVSFTSAVVPRLCLSAFTFAQPFLISSTVSYIAQPSADADFGKGLIGAWILVFLGIAASTAVYQYQLFRFVTRLRGSLTAVVYQGVLDTRTAHSGDITAVALMGTDIPRIVDSLREVHELWASPVDMAIAVWLLAQQLSVASVAPVVVTLAFIAATSQLSLRTKREQRLWIEKVQERIRVTSNMLRDVKAVKMLGLSGVMQTVIQALRTDEIATSRGFRILLTVRVVLSNAIVNIAPMVTFGVYVAIAIYWLNQSLLTAQAFTSITLISLLTKPVLVFIQALPEALQCVGCFDRIQEFVNYQPQQPKSEGCEVPSSSPPFQDSDMSIHSLASIRSPNQAAYIVSWHGQSFSWGPGSSPVLRNLNVEIAPNTFTAITGPIGSGKSSFLQSVLGELIAGPKDQGEGKIAVTPPVGYCAQDPWLENTTIRNNIVGMTSYDPKWYAIVQSACGLESDILQMPEGDHTAIGSAGSRLSGGQKQRIALARAVYSQAPVLLLDDTFSGMDTNTVKHITRCLLGPMGLLRRRHITVIFATHNGQLIELVDTVISLEDGKILKIGPPAISDKNYEYEMLNQVEETRTEEHRQTSDNSTIHAPHSQVEKELSSIIEADQSDLKRKKGDASVYKYYISSSGWVTVSLLFASLAAWSFCTEFPVIWVNWWSEANMRSPNENVGMYMGVYVLFGVVGSLMVLSICWLLFIRIISNSGYKLHSDLLESISRAPYWFFTATDTGTLVNRFSQDLELIDMELPLYIVNYTTAAVTCITKLIILAIFSRYLAAAVPILVITVFFLQRFYLQTSRQVRLLGIEARAPLFSNFEETVTGASSIRAFGWQRHQQARNGRLIDTSQRPEYLQNCIQQWLAFTLYMITTVMVAVLVIIVITLRDKFDAGDVGVSLTAVVSFNIVLTRVVQTWTSLESSIGAVARIKQFVAETEHEREGDGKAIPPHMLINWPQAGAIKFISVTASHRPGLEPVLRGISLTVKPSEHIAICGRSGSGKTSLILSLLSMLDVQSGSVEIDNVAISSLSPLDLRASVTVISQDPFLLPGSIRFNLDPFNTASDDDLVGALTRVGLWEAVKEQGLGQIISAASFSAGQKQLLCLARALVHPKKIIILDEATSSMDDVTERTMQGIIDNDFRGSTVLAVMHRLRYVAKYDRVALLDAGVLMEVGKPAELLASPTKFKQLYDNAGFNELSS